MKFSGLVLLSGFLILAGCAGKPAATEPVTKPAVAKTEEKVKITELAPGKGKRTVATGDTIWVQYRGTLKDGKEFDSNIAPDKDPLSVMMGQGAVIKGWETGLLGMKIGGARKLEVPASLAYGANGKGKIPPNSDLTFEVKLLGLQKAGEEYVIDTEDLKPGSGRVAKAGDTVTVEYVGSLLNGKVFEDTHVTKKPFTFTIGKGQTLTSIEEGVTGMKVGGKRKIIAPPSTAFLGKKPVQGVQPTSEVVFTVDLISIK